MTGVEADWRSSSGDLKRRYCVRQLFLCDWQEFSLQVDMPEADVHFAFPSLIAVFLHNNGMISGRKDDGGRSAPIEQAIDLYVCAIRCRSNFEFCCR